MTKIPSENRRFSAGNRPWLILIRGPRGMAFDRWLVRRTGFSAVSLQFALALGIKYTPTLLLTSVGVKSGELREAALPYLEKDGELIVVGSKGGGPVDPQWVRNLRAHPLCWLHIRRHRVPATARIVEPAEWDELFAYVSIHKPNVPRYQQRADGFGRKIPLVILTPIANANVKDSVDV